MLNKMLKNQRGLTLVELLAVIVIFGIIAAIAVPSIGNIIQNSREDALEAEALQILNAANLYIASNPDVTDLTLDATDLNDFIEEVNLNSGWTVDISDDTPTLTGDGDAGDQRVTFNAASKSDITNGTTGKVTVGDISAQQNEEDGK
jgi:type IV pilus assembly protein PilA